MIPTLDVLAARRRLQDHLPPTPLHASAWLSHHAGARVSLKLESMQVTGSFKIRGALNALLKLGANYDREIVTSSAGNHGRAIAYAAERIMCGFASTIVAGGTESMSLVPMGGHKIAPNPTLVDSYPDVYLSTGLVAENHARCVGRDVEAQRKHW